MKAIRIIIKAEPVAKGRPKTTIRNGKVWTFTPHKTEDAQELLKGRLQKHINNAFPAHMPIKLTAVFYRTKSKFLPKKETMPFRRPDLDNLLKLLLDSLDNVLVPDDAQITAINVKKRWTTEKHGYITIKLTKDSL